VLVVGTLLGALVGDEEVGARTGVPLGATVVRASLETLVGAGVTIASEGALDGKSNGDKVGLSIGPDVAVATEGDPVAVGEPVCTAVATIATEGDEDRFALGLFETSAWTCVGTIDA
jgi:hypothetical protein